MNDLRRLFDVLETQVFGRAHEHHDVLASTNDRASSWLREGGSHGLVVTADMQTAGRGRHGRTWCSPAGENLYVSLGLRLPQPRADFGAVSLAVGVGLHRGLAPIDGLALKWPNDVLVDGKKLAGILCESRWSAGAVELVIGFGINVRRVGIDPSVRELATSLEEVGGTIARVEVLARVLASLESTLQGFFDEGIESIFDAYLKANEQIGTRVRVRSHGETFEGLAVAIDHEGALIVRLDDGTPRVVRAADVETARSGASESNPS